MKTFYCTTCKHRVFFENVSCMHCGARLAFLPDRNSIGALKEVSDGGYALQANGTSASYRLCQNAIDHANCSWAVPTADPDPYCRACRLNETIPDLSNDTAKDAWLRLERAKRWLLCNLLSLKLPLPDRLDADNRLLRFSFLADTDEQQVFTGQSDGLITINIAEADDPFREKIRNQLGETYRTLLGHFRHEIGHYYWDQLIANSQLLSPFRREFGDERQDYEQALKRHYAQGAHDWQTRYVSAYASMHPWEDWAETWAHYLHIVDTLETARACDLVVAEKPERGQKQAVRAAAVHLGDFDEMISAWIPFTIALNSLNRSMGLNDAYPFVLSECAIAKLRFVHGVVHGESHSNASCDTSQTGERGESASAQTGAAQNS